MRPNFQIKFKNKIRFVNKKGLKQTLLAKFEPPSGIQHPTKILNPEQSPGIKKRSIRFHTISMHDQQGNKTQEMKKINENYSCILQSQHSSPQQKHNRNNTTIKFNVGYREDEPRFIDEMLKKHENLLNSLSLKTEWKNRKQAFNRNA